MSEISDFVDLHCSSLVILHIGVLCLLSGGKNPKLVQYRGKLMQGKFFFYAQRLHASDTCQTLWFTIC